jgi:hypothetical protein
VTIDNPFPAIASTDQWSDVPFSIVEYDVNGNLIGGECKCSGKETKVTGKSNALPGYVHGIWTFRTEGDIMLYVSQTDNDGQSVAWGITALFTFTPDPGEPAISAFTLSVSWGRHFPSPGMGHCPRHFNTNGTAQLYAKGEWSVMVTQIVGNDCCDRWDVGIQHVPVCALNGIIFPVVQPADPCN